MAALVILVPRVHLEILAQLEPQEELVVLVRDDCEVLLTE